MITEDERQRIIDEEHLRLLPVLYWVQGGLMALYAPVALIYVLLGISIAMAPASSGSQPPDAFGWVFAGVGAVAFLLVAGIATLTVLTGFWLRKRRHRTACLVVAGILCLSIPYGTVTGVFTFIVLLRPTVNALFEGKTTATQMIESPEGVVS